MKLLSMELSKICSKKVIWAALAAALLFLVVWQSAWISEKRVYDGGKLYKGLAAIRKDQELAKEFEGVLTEETVKRIVEKYGFSSWDGEEAALNENFCNRFVTRNFTEYGYTGEGEPRLLDEQDDQYMGNFLLKEEIPFGYTGGWEDLREILVMLFPCVCVFLMIATAPVFSEEYMLRTAAVALATVHGKRKDIGMKIAAALIFSAVLYTVCILFVYLGYLFIYGTDGLNAGALLVSGDVPDASLSVAGYYIRSFFAGLTAVLINTCITLAVSAVCRQNYITIILSVLLYFSPFAMAQGLLNLFAPTRFNLILTNICVWFPFYRPYMMKGLIFMEKWKLLFTVFLPVLCLWLAYKKYRDYQA